ncbi:glycosyltransferase family 4 protein [Fibrobacter succinogenes]|nr:glycosyltransferase family 4 protein [Fibrobacter succinogenes]
MLAVETFMQNYLRIPFSATIAILPILAVYKFLPGVSLAFFLLWLCLFPLLFFSNEEKKFSWEEYVFLLNIVIISVFGAIVHLTIDNAWFDINLFFHNMFSIVLCVIPLCIVVNLIDVKVFVKTVLFFGVVVSLVLIWQWVFLFLTGSFQNDVFIPGLELNRRVETFVVYRPSSFFTEPAHFSIYVLPAFQIALLQKKYILTYLFALSILCSSSSTGFLMLGILLVYHLCKIGMSKWYLAIGVLFLIVLSIVICYFLFSDIFLVNMNKLSRISKGSSDDRLFGPLAYLSAFNAWEHMFGITLNQLGNFSIVENACGLSKNYANALIYMYISFGLFGVINFIFYIVRKWRSIKGPHVFFLIFFGIFCTDQILFNAHFFYLMCFILLSDQICAKCAKQKSKVGKMKVLYLTVPSFFDLDISLVREMSALVDVHVLLVVSPQSLKSSAFSIEKIDSRCEIFSANEYNAIQKYKDVIDLKKWFVANNPDNSFFSCIKLSKKIKNFIRRNHFDILHVTSACKTIFFLTPFIYSFPYTLLTVHDPIDHGNISWFENFFRRKMFYRANKNVLLLSTALLDSFCKKYHVKKNRIYFSSLSVYDILTTFKTMRNMYGNYILFFGRIEPYKGVDVLVTAYEKSELPSKGIKLVIAGKGNLCITDSDLSKDVIFINRFIENDELANLIRHCKYVVLPYLSATQSGCVMSAFAFNKPVLATDVGDFPLTIENSKTGMICEANNIDSLCRAINEMSKINLDILSACIKERFCENGPFSWSSIAKSLFNVYESIVLNSRN